MANSQTQEEVTGQQFRHFRFRTVFTVTVMCLGAVSFGYAQGITGTTLGQPSFSIYMGLATKSNATQLISAMNAVYYVGGFLGTVLNGPIADRLGRKPSIMIGGIITMISAALLAGSVSMAMFIVFRFFSGLGSYMLAMSVPLWIAESVPPEVRGIFAMFNGFFINVGYLVSSYIGVGFYFYKGAGDAAWRGPLALTCAPCIMLLIGLFWMPESPRHLLMQGKEAEAWEIVRLLHSAPGDTDHYFAKKEMFQMQKQIELDRTLDSSWKIMFTRPSYRIRAFMAFFIVFSIAASGAQVIASMYICFSFFCMLQDQFNHCC
jgi:MFS family permease